MSIDEAEPDPNLDIISKSMSNPSPACQDPNALVHRDNKQTNQVIHIKIACLQCFLYIFLHIIVSIGLKYPASVRLSRLITASDIKCWV